MRKFVVSGALVHPEFNGRYKQIEDEEFSFEHCRGGRFIYKGGAGHIKLSKELQSADANYWLRSGTTEWRIDYVGGTNAEEAEELEVETGLSLEPMKFVISGASDDQFNGKYIRSLGTYKNRGFWEHENGNVFMYRGGSGKYKLSPSLGSKAANYWKCENAFEEEGEWKMNYEAGMNCDEAAELETESDLVLELV